MNNPLFITNTSIPVGRWSENYGVTSDARVTSSLTLFPLLINELTFNFPGSKSGFAKDPTASNQYLKLGVASPIQIESFYRSGVKFFQSLFFITSFGQDISNFVPDLQKLVVRQMLVIVKVFYDVVITG